MGESGSDDDWRESVDEFLRAIKFAIKYRPESVWRDPKKDWDGDLDALKLTWKQALQIIQDQLTSAHFDKGPEGDDVDVDTAVVFKFRYPVPGVGDAYVKLALKKHPTKRNVLLPKIWSFKPWRPLPPRGSSKS